MIAKNKNSVLSYGSISVIFVLMVFNLDLIDILISKYGYLAVFTYFITIPVIIGLVGGLINVKLKLGVGFNRRMIRNTKYVFSTVYSIMFFLSFLGLLLKHNYFTFLGLSVFGLLTFFYSYLLIPTSFVKGYDHFNQNNIVTQTI